MTQATLFETPKQRGMRLAAEKHSKELDAAKRVAVALGKQWETVTIDDVQKELWEGWRFRPEDLGNAAGSVFKGKEWQRVGYRPSTREAAHGRIVSVWRLRK